MSAWRADPLVTQLGEDLRATLRELLSCDGGVGAADGVGVSYYLHILTTGQASSA